MRNIYIATGHNNARKSIWSISKDRGASSNGTTEFDFINPILDSVIKEGIPGFNIVKLPTGLNINERIKLVNTISRDGDIYIEFHLDAASPEAEGCTTFYYTGSEYAKRKAIGFQKEYTRISGLKGRGVKGDNETRFGRLGVVRDTKPLALLVELGFITNKNDLVKISKYGRPAIIAGIKNIIS